MGIGQIVGGANARVDGVDGAKATRAGWHVATDAGQQHNQRHLAHIGRFAAHVRPGDDLQARVGVEPRVVGNEGAAGGLGQPRFDHRVAAGVDVDARLGHKLRRAPVQGQRALGQAGQHVQRRQRLCQLGQCRHMRLQRVQHLLVQPFFACQRAFVGRQGLVFKGFQFRRGEALGVFQRLAAAVVGGHFAGLALRHLYIEAMHFVELHAQVADAGAGFFARFQIQQKAVAVGLDGAQRVQLGIKARRNDAAVAHQGRRLGVYRRLQQGGAGRRRLHIGKYLGQIGL